MCSPESSSTLLSGPFLRSLAAVKRIQSNMSLLEPRLTTQRTCSSIRALEIYYRYCTDYFRAAALPLVDVGSRRLGLESRGSPPAAPLRESYSCTEDPTTARQSAPSHHNDIGIYPVKKSFAQAYHLESATIELCLPPDQPFPQSNMPVNAHVIYPVSTTASARET